MVSFFCGRKLGGSEFEIAHSAMYNKPKYFTRAYCTVYGYGMAVIPFPTMAAIGNSMQHWINAAVLKGISFWPPNWWFCMHRSFWTPIYIRYWHFISIWNGCGFVVSMPTFFLLFAVVASRVDRWSDEGQLWLLLNSRNFNYVSQPAVFGTWYTFLLWSVACAVRHKTQQFLHALVAICNFGD